MIKAKIENVVWQPLSSENKDTLEKIGGYFYCQLTINLIQSNTVIAPKETKIELSLTPNQLKQIGIQYTDKKIIEYLQGKAPQPDPKPGQLLTLNLEFLLNQN